eukprot:CAMPEP_0168618290 /NCGR_PEP_ID=MMETSP0449_2-20121227/5996_1 /TAXON_ID=1082188 /ORGANISM="Strombidium rassoulzadegani, Strain ras09" /LENGTH=59 /DNA_ID=CAMNT_0008659161 /DNA_START=413 /DNA_END=595 /DNA_ORIENTATION=+
MLVDFLKPVVEVFEGLLIKEIEDEDDAISSLVVGIRDRPIPLLARGVPDLELDLLTVVA